MRVSRNDRGPRGLRLLVFFVLLDLAVGQSAGAAAQTVGPPIPLLPSSPTTAPARPAAPGGKGISGEALPSPVPGWRGDTKPARAALPHGFWGGTPRALADILLARMPDTTSPALQGIERRLLLSPGEAPKGPDAPGVEGGLALLRAAALLRLGEIDGARAVIGAMPNDSRAAASPLAVEADAIVGNTDSACDAVAKVIQHDQSIYWQRSLVACQALAGHIDRASLGLQILAEQKVRHDDALVIAVDALAGRPAPATIDRPTMLDPLLLRVLVAANRQLAPALVAELRPDLALTLALDDKAPPDTRIGAAERAAITGALPVARLRDLYTDLGGSQFAGEASANSPIDRARRFVGIGRANAPAEQLSRIVAFVRRFPDHHGGGLFVAAQLVATALRDIVPNTNLAGAAVAAARLMIAAGDVTGARRWIELAPSGTRPLRTALALASRNQPGDDGRDTAADPMALALRSALGESVAPSEWSQLPLADWTEPGPASPPVAAALDLHDAARAGRIGETALTAALVAAPKGVLVKDPIALAAAVRALARVGLAADARRLAVEAALER